MDGANDRAEIKDTAADLLAGLASISDPAALRVGEGLPADEYLVSLIEVVPEIVRPAAANDFFRKEQTELWGVESFYGVPHYPKVAYYRGQDQVLDDKSLLFEFLVPLMADNWLDKNIVDTYSQDLQAGKHPTAVALAVLDIKGPSHSGLEHWCLTHYILDGHHKLFAAVERACPVRLLSFLGVSNGISTREQIERLPCERAPD